MSRQSSLFLYRPEAPKILTAADLARFVREFAALRLSDEHPSCSLQVKFGKSVDQDDHATSWAEPVPGTDGSIVTWHDIEYDAEDHDLDGLGDLADALDARGIRTVYRASILLGDASRPVRDALHRPPDEENEEALRLSDWVFEVGPVDTYDLGSEEPNQVGWMAVEIQGHGSLHPWTLRDLIDRAETLQGVRDLVDLCRRAWPVTPRKPPGDVVRLRRSLGDLWPYPTVSQPWDWCWGLAEDG